MDTWRSERDINGWKLNSQEWIMFLDKVMNVNVDEDWMEDRKSYGTKDDVNTMVDVDGGKV